MINNNSNDNFITLSKREGNYEKVNQYLKKKYNYNLGAPSQYKIDPEDIDLFAYVFGEESEKLTELIAYCMKNNISTWASCMGHSKNSYKGYITFSFKEDPKNFLAYYLASIPLEIEGLEANVSRPQAINGDIINRLVTLYLPANVPNLREKYFDIILQKIKEYKKEKMYIPDQYIKKIVDYAFCSDDLHPQDTFVISKTHFKKEDFCSTILSSVPVENRHLINFDKFVNAQHHDFRNKK